MLPTVISFCKPIEQRIREYGHLFSLQESCSEMFQFWASEMEFVIENGQWQAIWQLPEESCREFKALHPSSVLVTVQELISDELSARVIVEAVQEDIQLPGTVQIPIFELFPTKVQRTISTSAALRIANWLDRCRFFFLYLWYPWDCSDNSLICDWAQQHLEHRLKLQYDIKSGALDSSIADYINRLIREAFEIVDAMGDDEDLEPRDDKKLTALCKNLIRKDIIKLQLNLFESPELRIPMTAYANEQMDLATVSIALMVEKDSALDDVIAFLSKVKSIVNGKIKIKVLESNSEHALDSIQSGSTAMLSPGTHYLAGLGNLTYGGDIKGIGQNPTDTILAPMQVSPGRYIFLSCYGSVSFENLTIARSEGALVSGSRGTVRMVSCHLKGSEGCLARGVVVQPGCHLELINCSLSNLGIAIIVRKNAHLSMKSSSIDNCAEGIKMMDGSSLTLSDVGIKSSSIAGIVWETSSKSENESGTVDILTRNADVSVSDLELENNKVDALIACLPQEHLVES